MVNTSRKGSNWEREVAKKLTKNIEEGEFKRIPGSGAFGTRIDEPRLSSDVLGEVKFLPKKLRFEAKTGYGGHKQMTVKREWLEGVREESDQTYSIPALACKFSNARSGVKNFFVLDFDAFVEILEEGNKLYNDFVSLQERYDRLKEKLEEMEEDGEDG